MRPSRGAGTTQTSICVPPPFRGLPGGASGKFGVLQHRRFSKINSRPRGCPRRVANGCVVYQTPPRRARGYLKKSEKSFVSGRQGLFRDLSRTENTLAKRLTKCLAIALPWAGERLVEAPSFRLPRSWPARFWKRLTKCLAIALPWVRARGAHCKTASRLADGEAIALPFVVGTRMGSGSRGRSPSRKRHRVGLAFVLCAAVLPCAPRARTKGRGMLRIRQSASKNVPVTGQGRERLARIAQPFPLPKDAPAKALGRERLARIAALSHSTKHYLMGPQRWFPKGQKTPPAMPQRLRAGTGPQ